MNTIIKIITIIIAILMIFLGPIIAHYTITDNNRNRFNKWLRRNK